MYILSDDEYKIIQLGLSSPEQLDKFCGYWFNKGGGGNDYFLFDKDFEPQWRWQKKLVFAKQTLIVGVQGIGTGKTFGVGMAGFTWSMSAEGFKFMNGAKWAFQSEQMKALILNQILDTPSEKFIHREVDTPYPKIELKWRYRGATYSSSMEFMSMEKQARKIFSWRGDWINLDEAALIDDLDVVLQNLATRLTGKTSRGREYLGRMSLMTNPWDTDSGGHVYYFYDLAIDNPQECLSISIPTTGNKNVTDRQVGNTLRYIRNDDERARMLEGIRPMGRGLYFSRGAVANCSDEYLSAWIEQKQNDPGFKLVKAPALGAVEYQFPKISDTIFVLGDPGTETFPARNSPVIAAFDASRVPHSPITCIGFWWGDGNHQIMPFIDKLYEFKEKYQPIFCGVDSTGPQAGMVQILNVKDFYRSELTRRMTEVGITGLDFSVGRKYQMLVSLRSLLENDMLHWISIAKGIKMQLTNYDPSLDHGGMPKIAQDIVATFSMAAFVIRAWFNLEDEDRDPGVSGLFVSERDVREDTEARSYRA